jgi:hypothetical protein
MIIASLVRRARRRLLFNEALSEAAFALTTALALVVVLLVLGTQILAWQWLVALPVLAAGVGVYRLVRRAPGEYAVAQRIDRNLKLADTLSTAFFYLHPNRLSAGSEAMQESQRRVAEEMARTVSLEGAVPFQMPRTMYSVALLGVVASGLFGLRYGVTGSLDLRPPLAQVIQEKMGWTSPVARASVPKAGQKRGAPESQEVFGMDLPDIEKNPGELDPAGDEALNTVGVPETDAEKYGGEQTKGGKNGQAKGEENQENDGAENAQASSGAEGSSEDGQSDAQGQDAKNGKQSPTNRDSENSSLMAKLKEAMQNLLSRMKQQNQSGSQQASSSPNGQQQAKQQQGKGGQKGGSQGMQQKSQGQEADGSEDGEAGDDAQMAQNPQGKGSGQSPDNANSKQPGSGIGKQDGNKDAKLAEQLAAMGKISEIIGKRSANVSGEITVEVQSSNQQLRTPYAASAARHGEAAGEVARDEVPVMYQSFVQQYFEHVRKQETASLRPATDPGKPGPRTSVDPAASGEPAPAEAARRPAPAIRSSGR